MLKLTQKNIGKIKLLESEKKALEKLVEIATKKDYEIYLFGSRLNGYGADIDIAIKGDISLGDLVKLTAKVQKYTDTKIDIVPYKKETEYFFKTI